jgi:hypothetical protein
VIPLFPELLPYLEAVRDEVGPGIGVPLSDPIITRYRDVNANLRTQLLRIIANAGIQPWPKLFQNLRASRATELAAEYPGYVAAAWLGHSTEVAQRHYWQVTDADFERATEASTVAQNAAQSATVTSTHCDVTEDEDCGITDDYELLRYLTTLQVAEAGLEPARP